MKKELLVISVLLLTSCRGIEDISFFNPAYTYNEENISSEIHVLPYGKTPLGNMMLAFFKQSYSSDNFSSKGYKILYLVERDSGWYIIGEEMI